jgi:predicted RNA-binding protein with PIN domain
MGYLIDGNNVLGHLFPDEPRDRGSRYLLVSKLLAFQKAKNQRLELVFDGPPDQDLAEIHSRKKKFFVRFPSTGQKADDVIKEVISRQKDFRHFFVVTSDRELRDFARAKGAKTLSVKEFASLVKKILRERRPASELEKKATTLTPFEIKLWLDTFGRKNG